MKIVTANDVAKILGYKDSADAVYRLVKPKNKGVGKIQTPGGVQSVMVLKEPGIYQLIFGSKLPSAEKFQDWVFEDVLPSIRKTGSYSIESKNAVSHYADRVMKLEADLSSVPADHWVVMQHCGHILLKVEKMGYPVGAYDLVDGSIGSHWREYRKSLGLSEAIVKTAKYKGVKQAKFPIRPKAYHFDELVIFVKWLNTIYTSQHLPKYLKDKYGKLAKTK